MSTNRASGRVVVTTGIVAAYVANNHIPAGNLPRLIETVHRALATLGTHPVEAAVSVVRPTRARIRESVTPNALLSFIDGKPYKTLKRHLASHGLTPLSYRERYGLPNDYPMVASDYRVERSRIAKAIGLGVTRGK